MAEPVRHAQKSRVSKVSMDGVVARGPGPYRVTTVRHEDEGSGIANGCFRVTYAPAMNTGTVPGVRVALELRILKS